MTRISYTLHAFCQDWLREAIPRNPSVPYVLVSQREQAQVVALFITGIPVASILGAPLSGMILDHVHLWGWQVGKVSAVRIRFPQCGR